MLLKHDLGVLADGVREGRATFANTLKYIFVTTSANFGNMFSMAGLSLLLPFLPLLPKQILLTNFLSDIPAMTIASDRVDDQMTRQPRRWNIAFIRRFMLVFGLLSDPGLLAGAADGVLSPDEQAALQWEKPAKGPGSARWSLADAVLIDEAADLVDRTPSLGHVVADEAQDLSPMMLRAVGRRCSTGKAR